MEQELKAIKYSDYELHLLAGLADGGRDEDGERMYIGTDAQWRQYEDLKTNQENIWQT